MPGQAWELGHSLQGAHGLVHTWGQSCDRAAVGGGNTQQSMGTKPLRC